MKSAYYKASQMSCRVKANIPPDNAITLQNDEMLKIEYLS